MPIEERATVHTGRCRRAFGVNLEVRTAGLGGTATLEGHASVTETPYEMYDMYGPYNEIIRRGSFAKTLGENPPVQLLLNHGGLSMAYTRAGTLQLDEDSTGLHMRAEVNPVRSDIADMLTAIADGNIEEMSFAFEVKRQEWSPDYTQRDISEVSLHRGDVSVVNFGANPETDVALRAAELARLSPAVAASLRSRLGGSTPARELLRAKASRLHAHARASAAPEPGMMLDDFHRAALTALLATVASADAGIDPIVEALCEADDALGLTSAVLAHLLGVTNPDPGDTMAPMMQANGSDSIGLWRLQADVLRLAQSA